MNKLLIHMMNAGDIDHRILPGLQKMQRGGGNKTLPTAPAVQQLFGNNSAPINPTVPYTTSKNPADFYKSWIQSPEYARRQLNTGYSSGEDLYMPNAEKSRKIRLSAIEEMTPITYNTREASKANPGIYGSPSYVNINPSDYVGTSKQAIEAHELAHIAGAMGNRGTGTREGGMSSREQDIFKSSMLPLKEPMLSGPQGSQQREASRRALEDFQHSQKPDEVKADLDALRFSMYDKGIYDIRKGAKFSELDFENAKQKFGQDRVFKRLENRVGKKNFVNLMNTIAQNDTDDSYSNIAAYGGPILDPRGQWAHPGQVTRIPSNQITMQGIPYPVYAKPNVGQGRIMYPGQEYNFGGASYVDEYPMMEEGGENDRPKPKKKKTLILAENDPGLWNDKYNKGKVNPFITEAAGIKKYVNKYFSGEDVEIIPTYKDNFNEALKRSDANTRLVTLAHAGQNLFGVPIAEYLQSVSKTPYENCYAGTCYGDEIVEGKIGPTGIDTKDLNNFNVRSGHNSWSGFAPVNRGGEEGFKDSFFRRSINPEIKKLNKELTDLLNTNFGNDAISQEEYIKKRNQLDKKLYDAYKKHTVNQQKATDVKTYNFVPYPARVNKNEFQLMGRIGSYQNGGGLLSLSVTCSSCGHSWKSVEGGADPLHCHKCGGMVKMQGGGYLPKMQMAGSLLQPITVQDMTNFFSLFSVPQKLATKAFTGKYQTPSEAMDIKNPYGAFAVDAVLDPVNLVGAGLLGKMAKASTKFGLLSNTYKINPLAKKKPDVILTRTQKPGQTDELRRLDELEAKGINNPNIEERFEYRQMLKSPYPLNQPGYGRGFSSDLGDIGYYSDPSIQQTRGYEGFPEILKTRLPAKEAEKFNVLKNPLQGYISFAPKREFLLPKDLLFSAESFTPTVQGRIGPGTMRDFIMKANAEQKAANIPNWLTGYPSVKEMGGSTIDQFFKTGGQHGGLDRWFAEKWVDVKTGKDCGRQEGESRAGYPACRPSKRVNSQTPKTSSEMSSAEKAKFKSSKTSSQRIDYNHKRNK